MCSDSEPGNVRLCNEQGQYLARHDKWAFSDKTEQALVLTFSKAVEEYVALIARIGGPVLSFVPVDIDELLESCDGCQERFKTADMHFDGRRFLCLTCLSQPTP